MENRCQQSPHRCNSSIGPLTDLREQIERLRRERNDDHITDIGSKEAEPPFTADVLDASFPPRFKIPKGTPYEGTSDPTDHIKTFRT